MLKSPPFGQALERVQRVAHMEQGGRVRRLDGPPRSRPTPPRLDRLRDEVVPVLSLATDGEEEIAFLDVPRINCRALESGIGGAAACHKNPLQPFPDRRYFDASHHSSTAGRRPTPSLSAESSEMVVRPQRCARKRARRPLYPKASLAARRSSRGQPGRGCPAARCPGTKRCRRLACIPRRPARSRWICRSRSGRHTNKTVPDRRGSKARLLLY